jgi:predicted RNA binding protein YcfA (HicA-like mRNA interferase family)
VSGKCQLCAADVEKGLKAAGFNRLPQKATSHTQWVKTTDRIWKVTVDAHHEPFSDDLVSSMARQAGMSKSQFYEICSKEGQKKAKKNKLNWLTSIFD